MSANAIRAMMVFGLGTWGFVAVLLAKLGISEPIATGLIAGMVAVFLILAVRL